MAVLLCAACGGAEGDAEAPPVRPARAAPPPTNAAEAIDVRQSPPPDAPPTPAPVAEVAAPDAGSDGAPTIRPFAESLEVDGPLSSLVVQRILRRQAVQVTYCYEQGLTRDPALHGRVVMSFTISAVGEPADVSIASSDLGREVDACLVRAARTWRFPTPTGGGTVRVTYPFVFAPPRQAPEAPPGTIAWTLTLVPAQVTMARRAEVDVRITAHNRGNLTVDPRRSGLDFTVDGVSSMELNMAFGNGGMEAAWTALPPGRRVQDRRIGMQIVEAPGRHVIVLSQSDRELARAVFVVRP